MAEVVGGSNISSNMITRLCKEDLKALAEILWQYQPKSLTVHGVLRSVLDVGYTAEFWVDSWPDVKAVIAKAKKPHRRLYCVFYLDTDSFSKLLEFQGLVEWKEPLGFIGVNAETLSLIKEAGEKTGFEQNTTFRQSTHMYYMPENGFPTCDQMVDVTVGELTPGDTEAVNEAWKVGMGNTSFSYIKECIEMFPSVSLYNSSGDLIGFELTSFFGALTTLYVAPEHRKKGYGSYVTSVLARKLSEAGRTPYAFIETSNKASILLHEKVGFHRAPDGPLIFIFLAPKDSSKTENVPEQQSSR